MGFLRLHDRGGERLLLRELHQHLRIDDLFGRGKLEQRLDVRQAPCGRYLRLERVLVGLKGELATPLEAELACAGDIRAKLRLRWQGDRLDIPVCDLGISSRAWACASRAGTALVLDKDGLSLRGLDARIAPAGRVRATASLKPAAIDVRLTLDGLDLAPWRWRRCRACLRPRWLSQEPPPARRIPRPLPGPSGWTCGDWKSRKAPCRRWIWP